MTLEDLPPLREVLREAGIAADKRFGQHFLFDLNLCRKIARLADLAPGSPVIEVGPGPGGLTRALLEAGAEVVVIEADIRFAPILQSLAEASGGRLSIVIGDALNAEEASLAAPNAAIVANLPYNVGTPLLVKWLTGPFRPRTMTLMFQKEVARRIVASPGENDYGRLAVLARTLCETRIVMDLPARAFTPPPKVDSAVVRLVRKPSPPEDRRIAALQRVTQAAFGQRRKMLRSSLRALGGAALCAAAAIDPDARAETIATEGFLRLADAWLSLPSTAAPTA